MSTAAPEPVSASASPAADSHVSKSNQLFKNCWSCRVLSGGGLVLAGAYVYFAARKVMRQGATTSIGTVAQIAFAASE